MKSFFSRLNDIQAGSSKPTKESSYKFWIPSNTNAERSPPKPIPLHPDVSASHGEKRHRALKATHALKVPLRDVPTAPIESQTIHTSDMSRNTTRPNLGNSSAPYPQNYPPPSSRTPRPHEHSDTKYHVPSQEGHGLAYPTGTHAFRETSSKGYRGGRRESVAPVPRELWIPSATLAVSKQVEDQTKPHVQGTSEKLERYRESGDDKDRMKELERREKNRDRDRREKEKVGEREKGRTREREREERDRERSRAKERERIHEKEREIARARREQDRNGEIDQGRDHDKYAEKYRREKERDSDREGEKGKNRTIKDQGSRKESSNLTRGMERERTWDSDVPYDGERTKQDERSKVRHRDKPMGGGGEDNNREPHKDRDRWPEKEPERARERPGRHTRHRAEATDGEQDAGRIRTPAPDRERRKDSGIGWASDTHTGHSQKFLRNAPLNQYPGAEDGESSDSSTRPKRVQQVLTKRHRTEEVGSSSKIIHSRQGMPAEPLASTKSSAVKATIVTVPEDVQLPAPPTPQHMPIYLPPKESTVIESGLLPTVTPLNMVSARETEVPPRRETVNRLKSSRPDEPLLHALENVSKPKEIEMSTVRRPPSRGPPQPQNLIPSYPAIALPLKGTRESVYIHKPRHTQPSLTIVHDKLQSSGSSLLPEMPHTSTQVEGSREPNRSLERLPDSRLKKEVEVDLVPSVPYKVQHRTPPQSAGNVPSRQPIESTPQTVIPLASKDPTPPLSNSDPELPRKATHPLLQSGSNLQFAAEMDSSYNPQPHNWGHAVVSGNTLPRETQPRMGTPAVQVVLGKPEPMDPPSNVAMQNLQPAPLNENVIQDSVKQAVAIAMASKTKEVETVTQPQNEASLLPIKPTERSDHQLYTGLSIHRPSTAIDSRSGLGRSSAVRPYMNGPAFLTSQDTDTFKVYPPPSGWRNNVNVISPNILANQEKPNAATTSSVDVHPKVPPLKNSQPRSNGQESLDIAIIRPSTTTGFRQNNIGKNLRHHSNMQPDRVHGGPQVTPISSSHLDAQNSIGISIPQPSTATTIKQSNSAHSSRQPFNAISHKLNPLVGEDHSSILPGPSIPRHNSIPATNLEPITLPITEKGPGPPIQPCGMTPSNSAGPSLSRGHTTALPDVTVLMQDVPGSHRQGHTDYAAERNIISQPETFTSQASTVLNPKPDNLRYPTTPLAVPIPTANDDLAKLHSASTSTYKQDNRGANDHAPFIAQNSHQAFKENNVSPQPTAPASANNDSAGNSILPTSLNTKASNTQPIILPSGLTTPQFQIQRPPTSLSSRNDSNPSGTPSAVIVPQIQIHHLITGTSTGNKPELPHADFRAGGSAPRTPCTPGLGPDLETPDINRLATANANVLPIHVDQPQNLLGSGNKLHRPVHLVPTSTSHTVDATDVRPSINKATLPSHAEDPRPSILRTGSSQEVPMQTFVNNHSATLSSHQPDPLSSANQTRHDSVQSLTLNSQMNNALVQSSPSLGFPNNTFDEVLHPPVVRRSGQGDRPAMKMDGRKVHDLHPVSAGFETDKDDSSNQTINMKTSESPVNKDLARNAFSKEQPEVPSVERLITRKDLHIGIHNSKAAFTQIPSEVPSQPRIQHPGLSEILSSSPFNRDRNDDNGQPPSTMYHQATTSSTIFSKSGSSPKFQGSPDTKRLDDKLVSPKASPSRQSPSDLRQKEVEQHHESPKRQLQQTPTPTSRSAHLQNLLSDPHVGDSASLTKVTSSSFHPSATNPSVPDGLIRPFLESMPHVYNKKSGTPYPEVPISTSGSSQVEELASRKIRPPSVVDFKLSGNNIPHYQATTPLRESTSTTRHQYSASLPVYPFPSANVPPADGPLRSAAQPPLHHHSTVHSQTKVGHTRPSGSQTLAPNITHAASDSEETILMTPSSLAHSVMLKPTISRQSVTPSVSSQTTRKGTGIFTMFRSKTPAQPPRQYEIWHPPGPNVAPSGTAPSSLAFPEQKTSAPTPLPATSVPIAIERTSQKTKVFTPFRYLTTKRNRAVSLVSVEAQDGTAPSTVVGSPTASMHSQAPFQPPPVRDPMQATKEWRNKEEAEAHPNGKLRRQRPGVVFDVAEEPPEGDRQRSKRAHTRHKSSNKPTKPIPETNPNDFTK